MKQITIASIAVALGASAWATDNLSFQNSLSQVVVQDNLWYNPALIADVKQQVAATTGGNGGVAFNAFDQTIAIHAGKVSTPQFDGMDYLGSGRLPTAADAVDIFVGGKLFGQSGLRLSLVQNTESEPAVYQIAAPGGGTIHLTEEPHTFDANGDQLSAEFRGNTETTAYSKYGISFGQVQPKFAYSAGISVPLFNNQRLIDYTATNAQQGSATLTTEYKENEQAKSGLSFELHSNNRYYFQPTLYLGADFQLNRYVTEGIVSQLEITTGAEDNESQTQRNFSKLQLVGDLTLGLIRQSGASTLRIEQGIGYERVSGKDEQYATEVRGANDPTGVESSSNAVEQTIRLPLHASIEAKTGDKWSWRAGVKADLLNWVINKTLTDKNEPGPNGFELEYTKLDSKGSRRVTDGAELLLGLGWQPVEKLSINAVLNQAFITEGLFDNGLASQVSVSYEF
ncbi:hypothetical protein [Salinibius halmophilus]|uniref:hypothetical protein n=1 Tax=Salinibius halmophilus TaxID=1853216 RepID=UPI000E66AE48|nr:hypothetical protein [Salinibius halmophilus]